MYSGWLGFVWYVSTTFLLNFVLLTRKKTAFIEGEKLALVKEPFLCTITANYRRVELLFHVTYE